MVARREHVSVVLSRLTQLLIAQAARASLAQLVEHALRKRMVMGSIPIGGSCSWPADEGVPGSLLGLWRNVPLHGKYRLQVEDLLRKVCI